jgi:hypothetical protein
VYRCSPANAQKATSTHVHVFACLCSTTCAGVCLLVLNKQPGYIWYNYNYNATIVLPYKQVNIKHNQDNHVQANIKHNLINYLYTCTFAIMNTDSVGKLPAHKQQCCHSSKEAIQHADHSTCRQGYVAAGVLGTVPATSPSPGSSLHCCLHLHFLLMHFTATEAAPRCSSFPWPLSTKLLSFPHFLSLFCMMWPAMILDTYGPVHAASTIYCMMTLAGTAGSPWLISQQFGLILCEC